MRRACVYLVAAAFSAATGGCDMESLRSGALFPHRDAGSDGSDAALDAPAESRGSAPADAPAEMTVDLGGDVAGDGVPPPPDAADAATATGMLSGSVLDPCSGGGVDALVGIGGRHTCSFPGKGSFFFPRLPVGTLKLAATKEGYALYEATVEIVAGGNIQDIRLVPAGAGGCATLPSPPVACACTASTCDP